ncbi:MAG: ankyrin repeat domain-containing protein [Alcanivoracaceae bacterium]
MKGFSLNSRILGAAILTVAVLGSGCAAQKAVRAAAEGDIVVLQSLHAEGKDLNRRDMRSSYPLYRAAEAGQLEVVRFLVQSGANVDDINGFARRTALMAAVSEEHEDVVTALLAAGADTSLKSRAGDTALSLAVTNNAMAVAVQLINAKADPNLPGAGGVPPLYSAAQAGHDQLAGMLLMAGAKPDQQPTGRMHTALMAALDGGYEAVVDLLIQAKADLDVVDEGGDSALMQSLKAQRIDQVQRLLEGGADPDLGNSIGLTPLFEAIRQDKRPALDLLLGHGADTSTSFFPSRLTSKDRKENEYTASLFAELGDGTPLRAAVRRGNADVIATLLNGGAAPGESEMIEAVFRGQAATVSRMLAVGASADGSSVPLLGLAMKNSHNDVARLLLAAGAKAGAPASEQYDPPLMYAVRRGDVDMVTLLLSAEAPVDQRDSGSFTSLYLAAGNGHLEVVNLLLAAGADIDSRNGRMGWTPLMRASDAGKRSVLLRLIAGGADVNATTTSGGSYTALYYSVKWKDFTAMLLAAGADPNARVGSNRWSAAHNAANQGFYNILETLFEYGAEPNARTAQGSTPMDFAMTKGFSNTQQVIARYGGRINTYKPPKDNSQNMARLFATAALATAAHQSNLPSHVQADVMSAAIRDIWVEDGKGTNLAQLQQQWASGNTEIRDPIVREVFSASLQAKEDQQRFQQQLAAQQAQQQQEQARARQELQEQQRATERDRQQRQAQLVREQAERQRQQQAESQLQQRQAPAAQPAAPAPMQVGFTPMGGHPAAASNTPRREPQANSASIQRGPMTDSEKFDCDCEGRIEKRNVTVGSCEISRITVAYRLGALMGEPTVNGNYIWEAGANTPDDCLPSKFNLWLKISNYQAHGYVRLDPVIPRAGNPSFNVTGSPNWNNFICGFEGGAKVDCLSADEAKRLYRKGRVSDVLFSLN